MLQKIRKILEQAEPLNSLDLYNLACCYALLNETDLCHTKLEHCEKHGTLPTKAYLEQDPDLNVNVVKNTD